MLGHEDLATTGIYSRINTEEALEIIFGEFMKRFNFSLSNLYMPESLKERLTRIMDLFKIQKIWDRDELFHESDIPEDEFDSGMNILKREGNVFEPENGKYEVI